MSFSNKLPAPGSLINAAGLVDPAGLPAPGFKGVGLKSNYTTNVNRSRSNRGFVSDENDHFWSFSISYNEMKLAQYTALENFLLGHNTKKNPFYVTLPNYALPNANASFITTITAGNIAIDGTVYAGDRTITITGSNTLLPGCFVNIIDNDDALHKSVYKVTRVETPTSYVGTAPAAGKIRLTLFPPIQRNLTAGQSFVKFANPEFRVIQTNDLNPNFDENNIVSFSLEVQEILP